MRHPGVVPVDPEELRRFFEFRDFAHFVEVYLAVVDADPHRRRRPLPDLRGRARARDRPAGPVRRAHLHAVHVGAAATTPTTASRSRPTPRRSRTPGIAAERDFGIVLRWIYDIPGESGDAGRRRDPVVRDSTTASTRSSASGSGGPEMGVPRAQFKPHFDARPPGRAAQRAARRRDDRAGDGLGRPAAARRRADRPRHLGRARTRSCSTYLAETGIPLEVCPSSNIATRAVAEPRRAPDQGVPRRRRDDHGQLRRPVDVRHQPQPGVRDRGRLLDLDTGGVADLARAAVRASFAPDDLKVAMLAEIDEYARV